MAPPTRSKSVTTRSVLLPLARPCISTRSHNIQENMEVAMQTRGKRKADNSPLKNDKIKRSALGNLTNNVVQLHLEDDNKLKMNNAAKPLVKAASDINMHKKSIENSKTNNENSEKKSKLFQNINGIVLRGNKIISRGAVTVKHNIVPLSVMHNQLVAADSIILLKQKQNKVKTDTNVKPKEIYEVAAKPSAVRQTRRISNEFDKAEDTLYMSALEELPLSGDSIRFSGHFESKSKRKSLINSSKLDSKSIDDSCKEISLSPFVPPGVINFDKENWDDPFQVSHYTMDIFNYLKEREELFIIGDFMEKQPYLSKLMRSLLVDWMVEVQETFELNHETLYLAVKLVNLYLCQKIVQKDKLQLLGAAAIFIACKFDERSPPRVDDFMYICDGAYQPRELIKMEMNVLKTIGFDLGIPLSYRFLRRYARCAKVEISTLTLARYILELSLMDYAAVSLSDSQLACAALFIAIKMKSKSVESPWSDTLKFFTGYDLEDFAYIIPILNGFLHRKPKDALKTIRNKYSHEIFYESSKVPLLTMEKLLENTDLLQSTENHK